MNFVLGWYSVTADGYRGTTERGEGSMWNNQDKDVPEIQSLLCDTEIRYTAVAHAHPHLWRIHTQYLRLPCSSHSNTCHCLQALSYHLLP